MMHPIAAKTTDSERFPGQRRLKSFLLDFFVIDKGKGGGLADDAFITDDRALGSSRRLP